MKVIYRGHEVDIKRERCLGGWSMLYTSVFRLSDGLECIGMCEDTNDTMRYQLSWIKERIDEELAKDNPWEDV